MRYNWTPQTFTGRDSRFNVEIAECEYTQAFKDFQNMLGRKYWGCRIEAGYHNREIVFTPYPCGFDMGGVISVEGSPPKGIIAFAGLANNDPDNLDFVDATFLNCEGRSSLGDGEMRVLGAFVSHHLYVDSGILGFPVVFRVQNDRVMALRLRNDNAHTLLTALSAVDYERNTKENSTAA